MIPPIMNTQLSSIKCSQLLYLFSKHHLIFTITRGQVSKVSDGSVDLAATRQQVNTAELAGLCNVNIVCKVSFWEGGYHIKIIYIESKLFLYVSVCMSVLSPLESHHFVPTHSNFILELKFVYNYSSTKFMLIIYIPIIVSSYFVPTSLLSPCSKWAVRFC